MRAEAIIFYKIDGNDLCRLPAGVTVLRIDRATQAMVTLTTGVDRISIQNGCDCYIKKVPDWGY